MLLRTPALSETSSRSFFLINFKVVTPFLCSYIPATSYAELNEKDGEDTNGKKSHRLITPVVIEPGIFPLFWSNWDLNICFPQVKVVKSPETQNYDEKVPSVKKRFHLLVQCFEI